MKPTARTLAAVLAKLTDEEAVAVWLALGQWADNTRCGVEEDTGVEEFVPGGVAGLEAVEGVVEKLNVVIQQLAEV